MTPPRKDCDTCANVLLCALTRTNPYLRHWCEYRKWVPMSEIQWPEPKHPRERSWRKVYRYKI